MTVPGVPSAAGIGYGKAILSGLVQPFCGALSAVVIALVEAKLGHPLGSTLAAAVDTLISTPITVAVIVWTPHNLFSGGQ